MKKIILTAAIVCAAVLAQAATVVWDAGTINRYDGNAANKNVAGYLFQIAASDYASYAAMDATTLSQAIYADYKDSLASAVVSGTASKRGALSLEGIDATAGTPVYAAILYVDTANTDYFMGNVASVNWSGVGTPTVGDLAVSLGGAGTTATAWATAAAVPEPTSGLLMLVGLAGLALRRRRA